MSRSSDHKLTDLLESVYATYARREYVHPDPLEFLYDYPDLADRELVGLVAASLAYGNVLQILRSVASVLTPLGPYPAAFVAATPAKKFDVLFRDFKHRWTTGAEVAALLRGVKRVVAEHGSLEACLRVHAQGPTPCLAGLTGLVGALQKAGGMTASSLLPAPERGSACKRLHLYLRWMVRRDAVDPGGWTALAPTDLVVPLDVHMHRVGHRLGLLRRKQADGRAAAELTAAFRRLSPVDPVRYDFALTRLGIRRELTLESLPVLGAA